MLINFSSDFNKSLASLLDVHTFQVVSCNTKKENFDSFLQHFFGFIPKERKRVTTELWPFGDVILRRMVGFMGNSCIEVYTYPDEEDVLVSINYRENISELSIWWNTLGTNLPDARIKIFRAMVAGHCSISHAEQVVESITTNQNQQINDISKEEMNKLKLLVQPSIEKENTELQQK